MKIPLVDLRSQYEEIADELEPVVRQVLASGRYVGGSQVERFEREFAAFEGGACAAGVSSGTAALRLALLAVGVRPGDEVIVPAFTFIATAEAVTQIGAIPVLADVDPVTLCLDPGSFENRMGTGTAAVIPVHMYGHPADMERIGAIAAGADIRVIQDAAQAHGARTGGCRLGELADAACYSFYPSKNLGSCGEGGAVVTNDGPLAAEVRRLRDHGQRTRYEHETEGFNDRLHALQAAILRVKLKRLDGWIERRRAVARRYGELLQSIPVQRPEERPGQEHAWHLYVIRSPHRDRIAAALAEAGIAAAIHYPTPLHLMKPYAPLGHRAGDFPNAEEAARTVLSIPIYPELPVEAQERIARCIGNALSGL